MALSDCPNCWNTPCTCVKLTSQPLQYARNQDPVQTGVYDCRVPMEFVPTLYEDKFLMWFEGQWSYPGSDQRYRGEVTGWIGPLQRRMT